jgi:predicted nucleic-acid-binding protein
VQDNQALFVQARDFFDSVRKGSQQAILLESVIAECIYVLTKIYKVPRAEAALVLIDMLQYRGIANADRAELVSALNIYREKNIDIVDALLCARTEGTSLTLFTFDKELQKIAGGTKL